MKATAKVLISIILCIFLSGCFQYGALTTLRMKGKKIKVHFGSVAPIEGEDIQATLTREMYMATDKKFKQPSISDVKVEEKSPDEGQLDIKK